ncbi:uncharacterized protein LOC126812082 [Patella vulgata]|uniref:uncharacterized protein LOC126812082 n=1 Tax=Patella vulgata TaxID=6465 RepID=UPI00218078B4|nr:uncharacterized protein LOC126812082 [Patella vulgata]
MDCEISKPLGIRGRKSSVNVSTITQSNSEQFEIANFGIRSASDDGAVFEVKEGLITDKFNINEKVLPHNIDLSLHPHLKDLALPDVDVKKVTILIGKDMPELHDILEVRRSDKPGSKLQGLRGPLGWVITGTVEGVRISKSVTCNFTHVDKDLHKLVENFWKLDDFGSKRLNIPERFETESIEDKRASMILDKTTRLINGHYESGLLWKNDNVTLPNNRHQAEDRLRSLKRRFEKDDDFGKVYTKTMTDYIQKGYARKLSAEEVKRTSPRTFYLPHFGIKNENKPGKVRIVFDAAAEYDGTSLNKQLLTGPDRTNNLVGVLLRFRQDKVALAADVESMFHQVRVRKEDQDSLRFLWWTHGFDKPLDEYVMTVHIFGAADSPCSANSALLRTAKDNELEFDTEAVKTIENNFYVDDLLKSFSTPEAAIDIGHQVVDICKNGGFKLTKFLSNDRNVLGTFPSELRADPTLDLDFEQLPNSRALGLQWSVELDTLGFKVMNLDKPNTMRGVLSTICSVFDPLNIAAPVMIPAKQIMQELWRKKWSWDQKIEGELLSKWLKWKDNLQRLGNVKVQRSYFLKDRHEQGTVVELHHFCDASEISLGCVSFMRIVYPNGEIECSFVMGKSRNAPIKSISIPRLELQGAVLAARIHNSLIREIEIDIDRTYFWTDSMITLNYINNETRRFQTFVGNRITEIRELTEPDQWHHCPGKLNPADDVSRGLNFEQFNSNSRWIRGPQFLWKPKDQWPDLKIDTVPIEMLEVKKEIHVFSSEPESHLSQLINRHSNWNPCVRNVAWIVKFIDWLKTHPANRSKIEKRITTEDYESATKCIIREVQIRNFPNELTSLKSNQCVSNSSNIVRLKPLLSDGIIRVSGRLTKAPISYDAKHPMILPRKHHVTNMIIRHFHRANGHCGHEQVLSLIRERFWILKSRIAIREVIQTCILCRKRNAVPLVQEMANLPSYRLTPFENPFTYTGLDYFGPMYVKRSRKVVEKRWGALFVCMNYRAIHLELVKSLETDDFLLALMRFMNRRGRVKQISSDNGSNFVGAEKEIRGCIQKLNSGKVEKYLVERNCKWIFHTPTAAHMSGVWERIVKSVKRSLKAIIGNDTINEEVLTTVLTEAERIANSRPLTRNPLSQNDDDPLTPNHFLNVKPSDYIPHEIICETDKFSKKRWRQCQLLSNHYWNRWLKEYIPTLQSRSKWLKPKRNLRIGDLVLVCEDNVPKNQWLLGRVTDVFPGNDNLVRNVEVKTKNSVLKRPILKLCLLEAHDCEI